MEVDMSESVKGYVLSATKLLLVRYLLVLFPLLVCLLGFIFGWRHTTEPFLAALVVLLMVQFVIIPPIYGRINEIVTNKGFVSWGYLLNKYFLKYCGVHIAIFLIMCIPTLLFILMDHMEVLRYSKIVVLFIELLYKLIVLYAIPLIFYDNTIMKSLSLGFNCLLGNLKYNSPLIFILVSLVALNLLMPEDYNKELLYLYVCIKGVITIVVNYIIFTTITIILEDSTRDVIPKGPREVGR
jgi:hypothetical protein